MCGEFDGSGTGYARPTLRAQDVEGFAAGEGAQGLWALTITAAQVLESPGPCNRNAGACCIDEEYWLEVSGFAIRGMEIQEDGRDNTGAQCSRGHGLWGLDLRPQARCDLLFLIFSLLRECCQSIPRPARPISKGLGANVWGLGLRAKVWGLGPRRAHVTGSCARHPQRRRSL